MVPKTKVILPTRVQPEVMPAPGLTGVYTNKIHYLRKYLLDELVTKKFALDFMEPVDTAILQVPNYYSVITRPMDVGTIIKRVQNRYYQGVEELLRDFRMVINNCFTFNRPGDVVYRNCQKLEKFFHRVLTKMPKGEEKPSTKDPQTSGKQQSIEKACEAVQRHCRDQIKLLHISIAKEDDNSICKYFYAKTEMLSQKVDRHYFKTIEEFQFEVNNIFKTFDNQIKIFYGAHHKACSLESPQLYEDCHKSNEQEIIPPIEEVETDLPLGKQDITEVLFALKKAEVAVENCQRTFSRENEANALQLIEAYKEAAENLKLKINAENPIEESEDDNKSDNMLLSPSEYDNMQNPISLKVKQEMLPQEEYSENGDLESQASGVNYQGYPHVLYDKKANLSASQPAHSTMFTSGATTMAAAKPGFPQELGQTQAGATASINESQSESHLWSDLQLTSSDEGD